MKERKPREIKKRPWDDDAPDDDLRDLSKPPARECGVHPGTKTEWIIDPLRNVWICAVCRPGVLIHYPGKAFERHCQKNHGADFEVCQDSVCNAAVQIEKAATGRCEFGNDKQSRQRCGGDACVDCECKNE